MNVMTFLLVSLIVHVIPLPYREGMLRPSNLLKWLPIRLIWGTIAWAVICVIALTTLPWAIIGLIMSFGLLLMIQSGFRPMDLEQAMRGMRMPFTCLGLLIILFVPVFAGAISWTSDVANAEYFDDMIVETNEPLFANPIPDHMVRLVTSEYASYVAYQRSSSFGSNVEIAAAHITTYQGRLVWVCTVVSTNVLAENFIKGFIVVDANDPQNIDPVLINQTTLPVGEGLFWDKNIQFSNYLEDMTMAYQYAYPTWTPSNEMVYVQTRTPLGFDFVERAVGPRVYFENGTSITYESIEETPDWITQAYAEEWLERQVSRWGSYRRANGFDLFAGGFLWVIPPSNDRLEMTEDTRYIVNPDSSKVEAFIAVHPVTNSRSLAGVFRATKDTVYYHDLSSFGYLSGDAAAANLVGQLPDPTEGFYYGAMPLLYPVQINSTLTKWTWYCPIYWARGYYDDDTEDFYISDMRLHALAMVDASNVDKYHLELTDVHTGEDLVKATREQYVALFGGIIDEETDQDFTITANVTNHSSYVYDGNTYIVLGTDNATFPYLEGTRIWMNQTDWYTLLNLQAGDNFTATVREISGQFRIVAIAKNP
ncbi:MAG: hypothetical protein GF411_14890 [Candidatus Lokiarchaeota archaeon]|nr:hypothetical protein [Candidatus Lokiarchaeota archaeon]